MKFKVVFVSILIGTAAFADPCNDALLGRFEGTSVQATLNTHENLRQRLIEVAKAWIWAERSFAAPEILTNAPEGFALLRELGVSPQEISEIATARIEHQFAQMEPLENPKAFIGTDRAPLSLQVPAWMKKWGIDEIYLNMRSHDVGYTGNGTSLEIAFEIASQYIIDPEQKAAKSIAVYLARTSPFTLVQAAAKAQADSFLMWAAKYLVGKDTFGSVNSNNLYYAINALQHIKDPTMIADAKAMLEDIGDHLMTSPQKDYLVYERALKAYGSTGHEIDFYASTGHDYFIYEVKEERVRSKIRNAIEDALSNPSVLAAQVLGAVEESIYAIRDGEFAEKIADQVMKDSKWADRVELAGLYATANSKEKFNLSVRRSMQALEERGSRLGYYLQSDYLPAFKRIGDRTQFEKFKKYADQNTTWESQKPYEFEASNEKLSPIELEMKHLKDLRKSSQRYAIEKYSIEQLIAKGDAQLKKPRNSEYDYPSMAMPYYVMAAMKLQGLDASAPAPEISVFKGKKSMKGSAPRSLPRPQN